MDWRQAGGPWGRTLAALVVVAALWLLAGPRGGGGEPALTLGGPGLAQPTTPSKRRAPARYVVHVAGAVHRPGVYRVSAPGRLIDAVERAGGLTADADLTQVNLAARLTDGRQIVVPSRGVAPAAGPVGAGGPPADGAKLSLNAATAEQLEELDGVGPAMAAAIIERRNQLGGFTDPRQLDEVDGVGEKRLASLLEQVEL